LFGKRDYEHTNELEQRIKTLEDKVAQLEETLSTLQNMQLSEQMRDFLQSRDKSLKLMSLMNAVSDQPSLDFQKEEEQAKQIRSAKQAIDSQIAAALQHSGEFSDQYLDDPQYFNYEVESGFITNMSNGRVIRVKDPDLLPFVDQGLRITAYNGFDSKRVVVPKEIDGQPVISIGEKAFQNAPLSEVVLPSTVKAILDRAFFGCSNLKHIDLPENLRYMGKSCFQESGLESITLPLSIRKIPDCCFLHCHALHTVVLSTQTTALGRHIFFDCSSLKQIALPDSLQTIEECCFGKTDIETLILPSGLIKISSEVFEFTRSNSLITCVFLGRDTEIDATRNNSFTNVGLIYCLPGSKVQKFAREQSIPVKPLSEFKLEAQL
jgi:uncharacterized coiled-coil protein SlyX